MLDEAQAGIKNAGEIPITSDMQMAPSYGRKKGTKESLEIKVKEKSEKAA